MRDGNSTTTGVLNVLCIRVFLLLLINTEAMRAFYDKSVPTRNLITTISGILLMAINLIVSVLLATGKITTEQSQPLTDALAATVTAVTQIVGYVSSIILMFKAKD